MTILPKKKHQESKRNEQDHDGIDHRNSRQNQFNQFNVIQPNRSSRSSRTRSSQLSSNNADDCSNISDGTNGGLSVVNLYNDLESRDPNCNFYINPSNDVRPNINKLVRQDVDEDELEDEEDGYNSSDEHGGVSINDTSVIKNKKDISLEKQHEREVEFERQLHERKGFIIKQMATDGACMFRAVADQVYGDQEMHGVVRKHCMDYMVQNRDFFSQYITEDFTSYIRRKRNEHAHGNHIEMQALSEMYNRPIEVYQYSSDPINTFHSRTFYHDDNAPIRLSYHGNIHYNSIVDPYNPTVGVGLGLAGYKPGMTNETLNKAMKESEALLLEKEMLQDKIKASDWEATDEQLAELAARESYLQYLNDTQQVSSNGASSSSATSTQSRKSPPRDSHLKKSPPRDGHVKKSPSYENHRRSPPYELRKSPQYENRKSPSYEIKNSPSIENKTLKQEKKNSPHRKSPPKETKSTQQIEYPTCSNSQAKSQQIQYADSTSKTSKPPSVGNDWMYSLGYDLEFENDPVLAAVLAQSQQEYLDSLSKSKTDNKSEAIP